MSYFKTSITRGGAVHQPSMADGTEDYAVIDTPGSLNKDLSKWAKAADVILMPTHCSNLDLIPLLRCWDIVRDSGTKAKVAIIVNKYDERRRADQDFMKFLKNAEMPIWATLPQATAFVQANAYAQSVYDLDENSKATKSIEALTDRVIKELEDEQ